MKRLKNEFLHLTNTNRAIDSRNVETFKEIITETATNLSFFASISLLQSQYVNINNLQHENSNSNSEIESSPRLLRSEDEEQDSLFPDAFRADIDADTDCVSGSEPGDTRLSSSESEDVPAFPSSLEEESSNGCGTESFIVLPESNELDGVYTPTKSKKFLECLIS